MAKGKAQKPRKSCRTICLSVAEETYAEIVNDPRKFRQWLEEAYQQTPKLFPDGFEHGFSMKDRRPSKKQNLTIRRIELRDAGFFQSPPRFGTRADPSHRELDPTERRVIRERTPGKPASEKTATRW